MSDFENQREPVAAKDHRCEWCGETIPKGEKHIWFSGVWEGDWQNWRMHIECHRDASTSGDLGEGFTPFENERPCKQCGGSRVLMTAEAGAGYEDDLAEYVPCPTCSIKASA